MDVNHSAASAQPAEAVKMFYLKPTARDTAASHALRGNDDLLVKFNLLPMFNRYVKEQQLEPNGPLPQIELSYFPYISDLPGKNQIKPGNYIRSLLEAPEKSYGAIHAFQPSDLRNAFTLRPGPVPGFDGSVLGSDESHTASAILQQGLPDSKADLHIPGHTRTHHSSPHGERTERVDRSERGDDGSREHKHKKKKKKRKHEHEHEHGHHEGEGDEHRKKKKRKKERDDYETREQGDHGDLIVD